ncbi:MAG: glycosyltransferase family 4 protein [Planctomycetes bacterium]|nr:glycosyltransferase family 4 protein [Planctomycetota bacterium]
MKILHLIDSLAYHGSAKQLQLIAPAQVAAGSSVEICCLGAETPWSDALRNTGMSVRVLGWTRWLDFSALWNLRELLRAMAPDVIHVWRLPALRALAVVGKHWLPRAVLSTPLPATGKAPWWDRWLLGQVGCLAFPGVNDRQQCMTQGITAPVLRIVRPAVDRPEMAMSDGPIVCVGNLERENGFREAIWAFDILRNIYTTTTLRIVGAGAQLESLRALAVGLQSIAHVEFLGAAPDVRALLRGAGIVWVPSVGNCGQQVALEAMALGKAVVASDVPCLRDVIRDGVTGYLVPAGDVAAIARRTHALLQDEELRERLGQAAVRQVEQEFPLAESVQRWDEVYRSVAA